MDHHDGTSARWSERRRLAPFAALEAELGSGGATGPALDLGCGPGLWLGRLEGAGHRPIGLEFDRNRAGLARRQAPVVVADAAAIPCRDATVALVWCLHVLHHLDDPVAVLAEVRRVLRPGGRMLLAESVEDSPLIRLSRDHWPQWEGVPVRSRFRAAELAQMVGQAGLDIVSSRQHSPLSFTALVLPHGGAALWSALQWLEHRVPDRATARGAYIDVVAERAG